MTTANDILAAYPTIPHALVWVEFYVCGDSEDGENGMQVLLMNCTSLEKVINAIQLGMGMMVDEGSPGKHAEALAESRLPEFRTYLTAKMGMF